MSLRGHRKLVFSISRRVSTPRHWDNIMSANQRKNKKKKKQTKDGHDSQSTGSPAVIHHGPLQSVSLSCLRADVLFQGRRGSTSNCGKVYMSGSDMRSMRIPAGAYVQVFVNPEVDEDDKLCLDSSDSGESDCVIIGQVWPSSELKKSTISLSRFWQPTFCNENDRSVSLSKLNPTVQVHKCTSATFIIQSASKLFNFEEVVVSSSFRRYFSAALCDVVLKVRNRFAMSWRGEMIHVQFLNGEVLNEANVGLSKEVCRLSSFTSVRFVPNEKSAEASTESESHDSTVENMMPLAYFGGYSMQIEQIWSIIRMGLGIGAGANFTNSQVRSDSLPSSFFAPPKGMLLYGPRGTGKTLLMNEIANSLKAKCHVLRISHDILLSKFQGEAENLIQRLFEEATLNAPSLILVDDLELLCPQRTKLLSDLQRRVVSCLLTLIDGVVTSGHPSHFGDSILNEGRIGGNKGYVFILATSSQPSLIDTAMRRPGRLDREVELGVPTPSCRAAILRSLLTAMGLLPSSHISDGDIFALSKKSHGMVGADLLLVCKEAHMNALSRVSGLLDRHDRKNGGRDMIDYTKLAVDTINKLSIGNDPSCVDEVVNRNVEDTMACSSYLVMGIDLHVALGRVTPSALREVSIEVPEVRWQDIGGMQSVKQSLREVVEWPLQYPELFVTMKIAPPRGVLLYGPPGCSKTLMAKALATESGLNFLAVRGPELLSKWLGDSEKAVQALFKRARSAAPSLIFFDEIDAFAAKRGESSVGVNDRVLSQLLTEIDGVQQSSARVVIVAATNRPDMLDAALLRPGRIDRKIYVPPPDRDSRSQILFNHLSKIPTDPGSSEEKYAVGAGIDIEVLLDMTEGFSGAEVVSICNEAALHAIDDEADFVGQDHLLKAVRALKPQITTQMLNFYKEIALKFNS